MTMNDKTKPDSETTPDAEDAAAKPEAPTAGDETLDALAAALDEAGIEFDDPLGAPSPEEEETELVALRAECTELKDRLLRALADGENTRRRAERDRKDAERYGGVKLARDLLAVHDNLSRALAAADDDLRQQAPDFIAGVELTHRELLNAFSKHKIETIDPAPGEKFDPNRHQAMFEAVTPGAPAGSVIQVMQPGFIIADRLLRAAMVGVAKADPNAPAPEAKPEQQEAEPEPNGADGPEEPAKD